ncbi:hypothetical protein BV22DRAFT_1115669 [Leucogyrophana mollusca]|uniref:Uncharacterized protein n=1 Tax=Leucogyrophana mollusca TaxID=85980 RepID=A0ACB8C0H6_9AGAM|nr:hypothetical protein BV22DRAFT_1115669 [Leucogyrophana mollusca]
MKKILRTATTHAVNGKTWQKFTKPTVGRGKTVYPKKEAEQEQLGVRWDYDGEIISDGTVYHKFQMQPNAGKVPSTIKQWREANGGTHAVMANAYVKKDGTKEDVEEGLKAAIDQVLGI